MKRLLVRTCALALGLVAGGLTFASGSFAQSNDWKGFYAGGNAGGAVGIFDAQTHTVFSPTGYFALSSVPAIATVGIQLTKPKGFTGGGQVGYNAQNGSIVYGVEIDFGAMKLNDSISGTATYPCCAPTAFTVKQSMNTDWLFTARPRVGVAHSGALVYATGDVAMTKLNYQELFTDTFATAHENGGVDELRTGWTAGGGVEFHIGAGNHLSLKGEYLFANFGKVSTTSTNLTAFTPAIPFPTNIYTHEAEFQTHLFRFGFNYRF